MKNGKLSMSSSDRGKASHATDPDCDPGVHQMKNGKLSMSSSDRGKASHATDPDCDPGVHQMKNGKLSMSSSDRGKASHATDPDCDPGVHQIKNGVLSMSTLDRVTQGGKASIGSQRIDTPVMLLQLVSSTVDPEAPLVKKFTRNNADIADVLLKNQFFKTINSKSWARIKEWKDKANNSDDKSNTFTTKKNRFAPRASDWWKLSLHESEDSVKAIAPGATRVTTDERKVSESYRESEAQRSSKNRKRKH
jgi:hypothetical protein